MTEIILFAVWIPLKTDFLSWVSQPFLFPEVIAQGEDTRPGRAWCEVFIPISQAVAWQLLQLLVPALAKTVPTEAAFLLS